MATKRTAARSKVKVPPARGKKTVRRGRARAVLPEKQSSRGIPRSKQGVRIRPGKPSLRFDSRQLVRRLEPILAPEHIRWAEDLAAALMGTALELSRQPTALEHDPASRRELKEAWKKLDAFRRYWAAHSEIHHLVARDPHHQPVSITATVASLLRQIDGAIKRLPADGSVRSSADTARSWLGFAVVSLLKARQIPVSKFKDGIAVRILELSCELLRLPRVERTLLSSFLHAKNEWLGSLKR